MIALSGNTDIFFAVSNNNGTSFGTPINLSNNTGFSFSSTNSNNQVTMSMLHGHDDTPAGSNEIPSLQ